MDRQLALASRPPPVTSPDSRSSPTRRPHDPDSRPGERARKRSPNRVRPKPAHPAVISSILDSFDVMAHRSHGTADELYVDRLSDGSRPHTPDTGSVHPPSLVRSASPTLDLPSAFGLPLAPAEASDLITPPSIRTSRSPSGLSNYPVRPPSPAERHAHLHPVSVNSRTSSISNASRELEGRTKSRSNAEDRTRQPLVEHPDSPNNSRPRKGGRTLRRISSHESLPLQPDIDQLLVPADVTGAPALSRAEQIIARTSPKRKTGKARLYLYDDFDAADQHAIADSPTSGTETLDANGISKTLDYISATGSPTAEQSPAKASPIVDAIPTRTSSLRLPSRSPSSGKKKDKKPKRQPLTTSQTESQLNSRPGMVASQSIPESSWADLGDDDETVKRIRELREQRKSRLEESKVSSLYDPADADHSHTPVPAISSHVREHSKFASDVRSPPTRHSTESRERRFGPSQDDDASAAGDANPAGYRGAGSFPPPLPRLPTTPKRNGNQTSTSKDGADKPSLSHPLEPSLDFFYAQAVDAMEGVERELQREMLTRHDAPNSSPDALSRRSFDFPVPPEPLSSPEPPSRSRSKSRRKHPADNRWTANHPDLPHDLGRRKSRRKSTSDARRAPEDTAEQMRRKSVEHDVKEFLTAPRLTRKIKHPVSGRTISFSEVGDPDGATIFVCVGMGLTRYVTAFYDELATTLRLRLITIDRPGVGGSEPYAPNDTSGPLSWPDDVLAVCQACGVSKFSILAHSAGAIYALATALILPHLVIGKVHLLAPWIPLSQLEATSRSTISAPPAGALPRSQRILRVLPASFLKAANSSFMSATSTSLKPTTKRQAHAVKAQQGWDMSPNGVHEPTPPPPPPPQERPNHHRRESMMLMDQLMPSTNPTEGFPGAIKEEDEGDGGAVPRGNSILLSATATPADPELTYASTALNAAEHAEKERHTEYTTLLTASTWALATRDSNPATDLLVCLERTRDIGFRYTDVTRAVVITHGAEDRRVPIGNVKWLAEQINRRAAAAPADAGSAHVALRRPGRWSDDDDGPRPLARGGCEVRVLAGEGHGLMANAPIMSDILTEIAGYGAGPNRTAAT